MTEPETATKAEPAAVPVPAPETETRPEPEAPATDAQFWDDRYGQSGRVWSGDPNTALVQEVADLRPGTALDLGCGEGADAVWLAGLGWRVTAADVSGVALDRAAAHAADAGVADRIDWQRHDLGTSFPAGSFDLVSAQFLYFRGGASREQTLRDAAAAVAPGGILLIESHAGLPAWEKQSQESPSEESHSQASPSHGNHSQESRSHADHSHAGMEFPSPEQIVESLHLADGEWETLACREHERLQNGPDGRPTVRTDSTVKLRRTAP